VRLAEEGADIIAIDICEDIDTNHYPLSTKADLEKTAELVRALGRKIVTYKADVRERTQLAAALQAGLEELGHVDIVIANAGICPVGGDVPPLGFLDVVAVNLNGVINTVEVAMPHLVAGASIICTGSVAALMKGGTDNPQNGPGGAGYSHAKRGVSRFVHDLAQLLAPHSIRVNAVHPTNCNTDMFHSDAMYKIFRPDLTNPTREDAEQVYPRMQPMPIGFVEPEDISNAVLFLASDESRYVTGLQLKVDGGALLRHTTSGAPG
jgi:SDR family mycofactocin-dependent oxidoreductase